MINFETPIGETKRVKSEISPPGNFVPIACGILEGEEILDFPDAAFRWAAALGCYTGSIKRVQSCVKVRLDFTIQPDATYNSRAAGKDAKPMIGRSIFR